MCGGRHSWEISVGYFFLCVCETKTTKKSKNNKLLRNKHNQGGESLVR